MTVRLRILGVEVDALTEAELFATIEKTISDGEQKFIAHHNLHSIYLALQDSEMRDFYESADIIIADGMSLVLAGQLSGQKIRRRHRISWTDMILPLMKRAADNGWRVFFLGGAPGIPERVVCLLKAKFPGLEIDAHHGYLDDGGSNAATPDVIRRIASCNPRILVIGMGMPRQEHLVARNAASLPANIVITAGACMDYLVGEKRMAPRWLGKIGLEWTYRLFTEPRRLYRRYLFEPWVVLWHALNR
jgi:N-acetylglucosaminyldiphosphoundecaprenol N-acetyl-beta-D-mannosaminyltransferase